MKKKTALNILVFSALLILPAISFPRDETLRENKAIVADSAAARPKGAVVAPFGTPVFNFYTGIGPYTPEDRARTVSEKIRKIAEDPFFNPDTLRLFYGEGSCYITYGDLVLTAVTEEDARSEGTTVELAARARLAKIVYAIRHHETKYSLPEILKKVGLSAGIFVLLIFVITLLNRLFRLLYVKAVPWQGRLTERWHMKDLEFFSQQRQLAILRLLLRMLKWLLVLILLVVSLLGIFFLLPWTKAFSLGVLGLVISPLKQILAGMWHYLPNFITIVVILIVARLIIRLFKFLKIEIEKETLKIPGFYGDWALPTFNILRVLVILFTIVAIWPYLPGSGSQIFQGVSVFFGLVFSLTSASSLANFMAGLTITYTRAFKIGDRVKIGEVSGDIIEKSMLVTKIRTIKNEEITVPNTKIMSSEVINYSTCAPEDGLIMHTTVTIGYDAPWRQVHQLLIDAALNTALLLKEPRPFVLQTALNDFYISYQLNAYTRSPNLMAGIYSQLHQNIQDSFNNAGVEIMSPHYKAVRDGNTIAIPEEYRGKDYESPSFRVGKG